MTSNALSFSISPQSKKGKKSNKLAMISAPESKTSNKAKQIKKPNQPLQSEFAQILLESTPRTQNTTNTTHQSPQPNKTIARKISHTKATKIPTQSLHTAISTPHQTQTTNHPLTQEKLKIRSKAPQPPTPIKTNLNEALALKPKSKHRQKTLRDIQTIAKDNQLHLTKLEITTKSHKSTTHTTKMSKTNPQEFLQSQMRLHKLSTPQMQEKAQERMQDKITHKILKNTPKLAPAVTLKSPNHKLSESIAHKRAESIAQKSIQKAHNQDKTTHTSKIQTHKLTLQAPQNSSDLASTQANQAPQIPQVIQAPQPQSIFRESALTSLLTQKSIEALAEEKLEEKRNEKPQEIILGETKKEVQFKIAQSRETMTHFTQRLKEEIANYKPPLTKLSMELNPQELGKLEVTITKKGKELQISINANNPNALQTFIQNQNEFRNTLANAGFNNIDLSFSQSDSQKQKNNQGENHQKRNKNSLEGLNDAPLANAMEIKMVQYA